MADDKPQTFENHTRVVPVFHYGVSLVFLANLVYAVVHLWRHQWWPVAILNVLMALALLALFWYTRQFPITVQDRLIRLEMRLRLKEVLPPDLQGRIPALTVRQLVALRFASDGELPDLVRDVLAGKFATPTDIKKAVKSWQADYLRA